MAKMSESEIRKKLIQEGIWSWLFKRPDPIVINWGVIEKNMGYEIPEKSRDRYKKVILGQLYHILSNDSAKSGTLSLSYKEGTVASATKKYSLKAKK